MPVMPDRVPVRSRRTRRPSSPGFVTGEYEFIPHGRPISGYTLPVEILPVLTVPTSGRTYRTRSGSASAACRAACAGKIEIPARRRQIMNLRLFTELFKFTAIPWVDICNVKPPFSYRRMRAFSNSHLHCTTRSPRRIPFPAGFRVSNFDLSVGKAFQIKGDACFANLSFLHDNLVTHFRTVSPLPSSRERTVAFISRTRCRLHLADNLGTAPKNFAFPLCAPSRQ